MTEKEEHVHTRRVVKCTVTDCENNTTTGSNPIKCVVCGFVGPTCQNHAFIECLCDYEPGSNRGDWMCHLCKDKDKHNCKG